MIGKISALDVNLTFGLDTRPRHVVSEQFGERFDCDGSHQGDLGEDSVKRAGLQRIVQRNRDGMGGRSRML